MVPVAKKVQRSAKHSKASVIVDALELLTDDESDAAVVARAALAYIANSVTLIDGQIVGQSSELGKRLAEARAVIENSSAAKDRERCRIIADVEAAANYPASSPADRVCFLLWLLKAHDARFDVLSHALRHKYQIEKLATRLTRKNASYPTIAADLARTAGVETGNAHESYKQARKRYGSR